VSGRNQLRWFDRSGSALAPLGSQGEHIQPRISPDGTGILVSRPDAQTGNRDVCHLEASRGVAARLTLDPANDWHPVWSPDGAGLLFTSDRDGGPLLVAYRKTSMEPGSGESRLIGRDALALETISEDWSRDGQWVLLRSSSGSPIDDDLWVLPTSGDRPPFAYLRTPFSENSARFSPDGRWVAYTSNETGRYEVYVRPFRGAPADPGGKVQVSTSGGDFAVWRRDGSELFFLGSDLRLYSVRTAEFGQPALVPQPKALFAACRDTVVAGLPIRATPWDHPFDVAPDGQRFLVNCLAASPGRFDVILNWRK
jgi:Tol biopolymer transport system component